MTRFFPEPLIALLPAAPRTGSPVPGLTSLYHKVTRGPYGDPSYPGNCSGELIKDLLRYFQPKLVSDPMSGSGTCKDVCAELGIACVADDLRTGFDACAPDAFRGLGCFDFIWAHPPYWRMKHYTDDPRDLANTPTLAAFLTRYRAFVRNAAAALTPCGRLAILMGDYSDRDRSFVPLTFHTKRLVFDAGLRQCCTDIIRFSHGASSAGKSYESSFIPGLHDVCMVFQKP